MFRRKSRKSVDFVAGNPFNCSVENERQFSLTVHSGETRQVLHWSPTVPIKGTVLFLHGYGGNARRWQHVAQWYTDSGFQVYSMDQAFHGDNQQDPEHEKGWRKIAQLSDFSVFVEDAKSFVAYVEEEHPELPYYVHGHSMGGLVWILTLLDIQNTWKGKGAILCAPALRMLGQGISPNTQLPYTPLFVGLTRFLDMLSGGQFPNPAAPATVTTECKDVQYDIDHNPKMFGTMLCVRFWSKFRDASTVAYEQLQQVRVPFLLLHGTADRVTDISGSNDFFQRAGSKDKQYHVVEGGYHELMNGDHKEQVKQHIYDWLGLESRPTSHTPTKASAQVTVPEL